MNKRIRIEVTAADIKKGKRGNPCDCPIALACKRVGLREPDVCDEFVQTVDADFITPKRAIEFIRRFDEEGRKAVKPFVFHLTLLDASTP